MALINIKKLKFQRSVIPIFAAILFTFIGTPVYSDIIVLRSGQSLEGQIINQSRTEVTIETLDGERTISKEQIRRISYKPYDVEEERRKREEEEAKRKAEEEQKRKELEEQRKAEEAKRLERERAEKLNALRKLLPGEEVVWTRMHMDFSGAKDDKDSDETAMLEDPTVLTGGSGGSPLSAFWRSAILPGWGQHYLGRQSAGYSWGGTYLLALAVTASAWKHADSRVAALDNYNRQRDMLMNLSFASGGSQTGANMQLVMANFAEGKKSSANRALTSSNLTLGILGVVYTANLVDVLTGGIDVPLPSLAGDTGLSIRTDGFSRAEIALEIRF